MLITNYADGVIATISAWDRDGQLDRLTAHLLEHRRQEIQTQARAQNPPDDTPVEALARNLANGILGIVETLPDLFARLRAAAEDRNIAPSIRAALLSVVAYVAQPHDVLPDDGSVIGLLDDAAVVYGVARDFLPVLQPQHLTEEHLRFYLGMLLFAIPEDRASIVGGQIKQVAQAFAALQQMPAPLVDSLLVQLYDDPNVVAAVLAQPAGAGMAGGAPGPMPGGFGSFGAGGPIVSSHPGGGSTIVEGDDISMSFAGGGGAAMVGGEIIGWD